MHVAVLKRVFSSLVRLLISERCCIPLIVDDFNRTVFFRVELLKMSILRPSPEVARYTMVFHKRDSGNQVNKDRSGQV